MKIVKNACYGGFGLSDLALLRLSEITGEKVGIWDYMDDEARTSSELIQVVEELGEKASDDLSNLVIVDIPNDVEWCITNYDGWETVEEVHRSW